ncbi:MAG TPA: cytochrome c oxidase assembly protein, partial [Solirubrobacterales bacterium]|nr:cytochrome c oxidase assembly protein [Solirubrobacterales bacterium]
MASETLPWNLRPEVLASLVLAAGLYTVGWRRLSRREPRASGGRRLGLALGALFAIALALLSPLDALAHRLFVAHMVQHMLLIAVAAPALLLADPYPALL